MSKELHSIFPNASPSFLRLNGYASIPMPVQASQAEANQEGLHDAASAPANPVRTNDLSSVDTPPTPKPKRRASPRALAKGKAQGCDSSFYLVRVTSFRNRLIDTDNLVPKWHVDSLRYAGILPDDAPERASIETSQEKVDRKEDERTEIEIIRLPRKP